MYNELIDALRTCADHNAVGDKCYGECPYNGNYNECVDQMILDAADALEAAEQRIAELEARMPKEGKNWEEKPLINGNGTRFGTCPLMMGLFFKSDFYCADGKRKNNETKLKGE